MDFDSNDTSARFATETSTIPSDNRENRGIDQPNDNTNSENFITNEKITPPDEIDSNPQKIYVIYGVEIGLSIFAGILMITTNALLSKYSIYVFTNAIIF